MCYHFFFAVVIDKRHDKNCDIGQFELAFRQPAVSVPTYIGMDLTVQGVGIRKPLVPKQKVVEINMPPDASPVATNKSGNKNDSNNLSAAQTGALNNSELAQRTRNKLYHSMNHHKTDRSSRGSMASSPRTSPGGSTVAQVRSEKPRRAERTTTLPAPTKHHVDNNDNSTSENKGGSTGHTARGMHTYDESMSRVVENLLENPRDVFYRSRSFDDVPFVRQGFKGNSSIKSHNENPSDKEGTDFNTNTNASGRDLSEVVIRFPRLPYANLKISYKNLQFKPTLRYAKAPPSDRQAHYNGVMRGKGMSGKLAQGVLGEEPHPSQYSLWLNPNDH